MLRLSQLLVLFVLAFGSCGRVAFAQLAPPNTPLGLPAGSTVSGSNLNLPGNVGVGNALLLGPFTVSTLPAASSVANGGLASVTDGASTTDCTTGSGSTFVLCKSNHSVWAAAAGGISTPVSPSNGGTGVSNASGSTITLAGPFNLTGAGGLAVTVSGASQTTLALTGGATNAFAVGSGYAATFMGGSVGIGTTSPSAKLDVQGVTGLISQVKDTTLGTNYNFTTDSSGRAFLNVTGQPGASATAGAYQSLTGYQETWVTLNSLSNTSGQRVMRFGTAGNGTTENMFAIQSLNDSNTAINATPFRIANNAPDGALVINNLGNVGIGTTSPGAKLDVSGNAFIGPSASSTFGGTATLLVGSGIATTGVTTSVCQDGQGQSTTPCFAVKNNGGTANVTITGGGIITDLPQAASGGTPAVLCINSSGQIVKGSTASCTGS